MWLKSYLPTRELNKIIVHPPLLEFHSMYCSNVLFFFSQNLDLYEQCSEEQSGPEFGTKCTFPSQKIVKEKD